MEPLPMTLSMKKALRASLVLLALPGVAFAAINNISDFGSFIINTINNILVPVLFAIAFVVFLWGAFQVFILGANSEENKEHGKAKMLYGLIGFVVMVSVWGLVNLLTGSLQFGNTSGPTGGTPTAGVHVGQ